jgi:hypothetical protein
LLQALVVDALANPPAASAPAGDESIAGLGLSVSNDAAELMVPNETDSDVIWQRSDPANAPAGTLFAFVDVFDFCDDGAMRYFDYVKGVATAPTGAIDEGTFVVLRRSDVDVVDLTA